MTYYTPPQARAFSIASSLTDHQPSRIWNPSTKPLAAPFNPTVYDPRRDGTPPTNKNTARAESWRVISPPMAQPSTNPASPLKQVYPPSVKHLTCYFWAKNGNCKWSDNECLYAHHDTGKIANGPMQVEPGKPAVAGKNATTARPVYEDWRSGIESPNNSSSSHKTAIDPEIQEQIKSIAAKAKANGSVNNSLPNTAFSQNYHQFKAISPVAFSSQWNGQTPFLSYSELLHVEPMKTLAQVTESLTTVIRYSQDLVDRTAGTLQYEAQALEDIFNDIAPTPINGLYPPIPYLQNLLNSRRNILATMDELAKMGTAIHDVRLSIVKDLEKADLMSLAPDWIGLNRAEGSG